MDEGRKRHGDAETRRWGDTETWEHEEKKLKSAFMDTLWVPRLSASPLVPRQPPSNRIPKLVGLADAEDLDGGEIDEQR